MARLDSKQKLIDYVKTQLGHPVITVEVPNAQIGQIIDDVVQKFTEFSWGTLEGTVLVQLNGKADVAMPSAMTNVIKLSKGSTNSLTNFGANYGAGYVPDMWSQQFFTGSLTGSIIPNIISISATRSVLDKYFGDDIVYNFNPHKKVLQVLENYVGPCVLHYQYEYIADDNNDLVFNHEWVKAYSKAKTKELWGTITGKYDQALVGGARINYDRMLTEAQQEIEKLDEQLLSKFSDPAPVMVG